MKRLSTFLLCSLLAGLLLPLAIVQRTYAWSTEPSVNTQICTAISSQSFPVLTGDGRGGAIIAWMDFRSGNYDIYAQRVDSAGTSLWEENGLPVCRAADDQAHPYILPDGSGGAVIAWQDRRSGQYDIYAQRVNSSGFPVWADDGVEICTASSEQTYPYEVSDGSGGVIIMWQDYRSGNYDIYARKVDSEGVPQWAADGVPVCTAGGDQAYPDAVADTSGGAIIAWQDYRSGNYDIYVQRIDSAGVTQWTGNGTAVCTAVSDQVFPYSVEDGSGGAIMAWMDHRSGNYDIYVQRVNAAGVPQWASNGRAVCTAASDQACTGMVEDNGGGAIMSWMDRRNGSDYDVYAQRVDSAGMSQWTYNGNAVCVATGDQPYPSVANNESGGVIIAWMDYRSGSNYDVYSQKLDPTGVSQWTENGLAVCVATGDQPYPGIVGDGLGGAIFTWMDYRNGNNYDIYAQKVHAWGRLGSLPDQPLNMSPADGSRDISTTPVLVSSAFSDDDGDTHMASQWRITHTPGDYSTPILDSGVDDVNLRQFGVDSGVLLGNSTYYWQMRQQDGFGIWSAWSEETCFTTQNHAPSQPGIILPADGAVGTSLVPVLQSAAFSDPDPGDSHSASEWRVTTIPGDYSVPVIEISDNVSLIELAIGEDILGGCTVYYWQVRHQDSLGAWSQWSEEACFTTMNRQPNTPSATTPANDATNVSLTPMLESSAFCDPDIGQSLVLTQWQITTISGDYSKPVFDRVLLAGSDGTIVSVPPEVLSPGRTYYWRVRHQDSEGSWSQWSEEMHFTTHNATPYWVWVVTATGAVFVLAGSISVWRIRAARRRGPT